MPKYSSPTPTRTRNMVRMPPAPAAAKPMEKEVRNMTRNQLPKGLQFISTTVRERTAPMKRK
jgi:hypothetical protein